MRVLLVDDDPVNTMIAEQMLLRMNARVDAAHSGIEALEHLKRAPYDAVLMDWRVPGMDGLQTTRCLRAGMDDVLVKPVNKLQLQLAVQRQVLAQVQVSAAPSGRPAPSRLQSASNGIESQTASCPTNDQFASAYILH